MKSIQNLIVAIGVMLLPLNATAELKVYSYPVYSQVSFGVASFSVLNEVRLVPPFTMNYNMPEHYAPGAPGNGTADEFKVTGNISAIPNTSRADVSSTYRKQLYVASIPGRKVRIKVQANFSIIWTGMDQENYTGFNYYSVAGINTGAQVSRAAQPLVVNGSIANSGEWSGFVTPSSNSPLVIGDTAFYLAGQIEVIGKGGLYATDTTAKYESEVTAISANYVGKHLEIIESTNGQSARVNEVLPQPLKVRVWDEETGMVVPDVPITFSIQDPVSGAHFSDGNPTTIVRTVDGIASIGLTLGASSGTYKVTATCPEDICTPDDRAVEFLATARSKELTCDGGICYLHGQAGKRFPTPFRLMVIDKLTGQPASGVGVSYEVVSFIDTSTRTHSGDNGVKMDPQSTTTDASGSHTYFPKGAPGTYIIRARCPTCLEGQEQILRAGVHTFVSVEASAVSAGDPNINSDDCIDGCCPETPVLRLKFINPPNNGVSFTSAEHENTVGLFAGVEPSCLKDKASVTWKVEDAQGDYMDSGTPDQPPPGQYSNFVVGSGRFVVAPDGRPLPLAYEVTATIEKNGVTTTAEAVTRQDEIDKCRQEYIDIPIIQQWTPDFMSKIGRNLFREGFGEFVGRDYVDCYAHIYPSRAEEAKRLIKEIRPRVYVTSGYRSPRHNEALRRRGLGAAPNSSHMYGRGVDLAYSNAEMGSAMAPRLMLDLWDAASCPMILERRGRPLELLVCDSNGNMSQRYLDALSNQDDNGIPVVFYEAAKLHLGE